MKNNEKARAMPDDRDNSVERMLKDRLTGQSLSPEDISQLLLASSLSASKPLLGLIKFLISEKIIDANRLKAFLSPMLSNQSFPPATKAMLEPIWKSFLAQVAD